jgi:hypothetical protein
MRTFTKPHPNPGEAGKAHYSALYGKPGTTDHKRLPAYAKQLVEARKRGVKPWLVACQIGGDWSSYPSLPKICLKPAEYSPGLFDFSCLSGLFTILMFEDGTQQQALDLAREITQQRPSKLLIWDGSGTFPPEDLEGWA